MKLTVDACIAVKWLVSDLPDVLTLCPDRSLVERATQMAFELAHPIYDCVYLACAEATGTAPVIEPDKLDALVRAYELYAQTEQAVVESLPGGTP